MKKTYQGSCHCGKVRFEADVDSENGVRRCNCWICARQRKWETLIKAKDFRLLTNEAELCGYPFGLNGGHHLFCRTCGVASFRRGYAESLGGEYVSITAACLHDVLAEDDHLAHDDAKPERAHTRSRQPTTKVTMEAAR